MSVYYAARKEDMLELRLMQGWTIQRIADKHNISRERVRQVIGNTGRIAHRKTDILKDKDFIERTLHMTNEELGLELDICESNVAQFRSKFRHAVKGNGNVRKGFDSEEFASAWLKANGIHNKLMSLHAPFDILALSKVRIDVKVAHKQLCSPSLRYISPAWVFNVGNGNKREDTDFYLCIVASTEAVFVIPASKVPKNRDSIRFCWPTSRPEISKFQQYLDACNLIFEFAENPGNGNTGEETS